MSKVIIIAEAGVNHNGDINLAKKLVDEAVIAKADYVKFQYFSAKNLVSSIAKKAEYQIKNTGVDDSQLEMIKKLELSESDFLILRAYCADKGIGFLASPFDIEAIKKLDLWDVDFFKIPSGEITNLPYLRELKKYKRKIVLSTGMCELFEVKRALEVLEGCEVVVLHCNTEYPTPFEDVNLNAMLAMKKELGVQVGYSDHSMGIEVPIAAVALGATIIEKHFSLSRDMEGPDHVASLEPNELREMITSIRNIEKALGDGVKKPSASEKKNIEIARKSIVATRNIKSGEVLSSDNIIAKRPGYGISPMQWDNVVGSRAKRDFQEDELIEL